MTPDYLLDGFRPGRPTEYDYANKGVPMATSITYKFKAYKRRYIGFTLTIEQQYGDWNDNEIPGGNVFNLQTTVKGAFKRTCYTFGADFTYDYVSKGNYRQYLVAGMGMTYEHETDQYNPDFYNQGYINGMNTYGPMLQHNNKTHINGYFSPLGMSVGNRIRYFFELGFGYRGIINTGLCYRFDTKQ